MSSYDDSDRDSYFLHELKSICKLVNWEVEKQRCLFFEGVELLITNWKGQLPDLRKIFRREEMDWLLKRDVKNEHHYLIEGYNLFIQFVVRTGYKDEPVLDTDGKPLLSRSTALHYAVRNGYRFNADELFKIYDRFDLNYTDESGLTHLHVACKSDCKMAVKKFLDLGQDPNCLWQETGDSPLHLAMEYASRDIVELLLRGGADPNVANENGYTPLHVVCQTTDDKSVDILFKIMDEMQQTVDIDARDKKGRTPLQLAVADNFPHAVDVLLDRGADLSDFVIPTANYSGIIFDRQDELCNEFVFQEASKVLIIVELLKKRGYELNHDDAMAIMKSFANTGLFEKSASLDTSWCDDKEFAKKAKTIEMRPSLSFYDLVRLRPREVEKLFSYTNYNDLVDSKSAIFYLGLLTEPMAACIALLTDITMRRFCRPWVLESFLELTRNQLPILCCEMIIGNLSNEDSWHICLAATDQNS